MAKVKKTKNKSRSSRSRNFSVKKTSRPLRRLKRSRPSRYQLKQTPPGKFTIYREEPKKGFFHGRTIEHHAYRITILTIIMAISVVFAGLVYMLDHPPERQVKDKIDSLAADYYEDIFYPSLVNSYAFDGNLEQALSKYVGKGMSRVYLRQFLLLEDVDDETTDLVRKYCDENATYVRFFPEPPYTKDAYHTEVTYSCNFD